MADLTPGERAAFDQDVAAAREALDLVVAEGASAWERDRLVGGTAGRDEFRRAALGPLLALPPGDLRLMLSETIMRLVWREHAVPTIRTRLARERS